jgi:hypothetical protein
MRPIGLSTIGLFQTFSPESFCQGILVMDHLICDMRMWPNKSPEPTAVGACRPHSLIAGMPRFWASKPIATPIPKVAEIKPVPHVAEVPKPMVEQKPVMEDVDAHDGDHAAIKNLICKEAGALDYTATTEELVQSGGRIDVVLRRGNLAIACEVSATNTPDYEVANIVKCLHAGFNQVASISRNRKKLAKIQESLPAAIPADQMEKVSFYAPDEFVARLFEWATDDPAGAVAERKKPHKHGIGLMSAHMTEAERKEHEREMLKKIAEAMTRGPPPPS